MARTVSEKLTCDACGTATRVMTYTIVKPDGAAVIDLCAGDAKPLLKLWSLGSTKPRKRGSAGPGQETHAVIPVD